MIGFLGLYQTKSKTRARVVNPEAFTFSFAKADHAQLAAASDPIAASFLRENLGSAGDFLFSALFEPTTLPSPSAFAVSFASALYFGI